MHTFEPRDIYAAGILDHNHAMRVAEREQIARDLNSDQFDEVYLREMAHREQMRVAQGLIPPIFTDEVAKES